MVKAGLWSACKSAQSAQVQLLEYQKLLSARVWAGTPRQVPALFLVEI
jgi:hypothetical protein